LTGRIGDQESCGTGLENGRNRSIKSGGAGGSICIKQLRRNCLHAATTTARIFSAGSRVDALRAVFNVTNRSRPIQPPSRPASESVSFRGRGPTFANFGRFIPSRLQTEIRPAISASHDLGRRFHPFPVKKNHLGPDLQAKDVTQMVGFGACQPDRPLVQRGGSEEAIRHHLKAIKTLLGNVLRSLRQRLERGLLPTNPL
jgi:hypothetical protein